MEIEAPDEDTKKACAMLSVFQEFMKEQGEPIQRLTICANVAALYMSNHFPGAWNKTQVQNAMLGIACMTSLFSGYKTATMILEPEDRPKDLDFHSFCLGLCFGPAFGDMVRGEVEKIHAVALAAQRNTKP